MHLSILPFLLQIFRLMQKRAVVTGSTLRASPSARKAQIARSLRDKVWPLFAAKKLKPVIYRVFPLADAAENLL